MTAKRQILQAAGRLIHTQGYRATTMEQVVEQSGVSKGAVYHHFPSKDLLVQAALDFLFEELSGRFLAAMAAEEDPLDQIRALMGVMLEVQGESRLMGCPVGNLVLELAGRHPTIEERLGRMIGILTKRIRMCLKDAQRQGLVDADLDADRSARFLLAGLEGGILLARASGDMDVLRSCVEESERYLNMLQSGKEASPKV